MVQAHEKKPIITIDDLQPKDTIAGYRATWQERGLIAWADLLPVEDQPARGFILECSYNTVTGREPGNRQIDTGTTLVSRVRELMTGQIVRAGWLVVGTLEGTHKDIWQHSSRITSSASEQDQPAPLKCDSCGATQGNIIADKDQKTGEIHGYLCAKCSNAVRLVRGQEKRAHKVVKYIEATREQDQAPAQDKQVSVTMDDFAYISDRHNYQATAIQGDVQAIVSFHPVGSIGKYALTTSVDGYPWPPAQPITQEQRDQATALLPDLVKQVRAATLRAGWSFLERLEQRDIELWTYAGRQSAPASSAPALQVEQDQAAPVPVKKASVKRDQAAPSAPGGQASRVLYHAKTEEKPTSSYKRTITASEVTYTCVRCDRKVTKTLFPGAAPQYCDSCAVDVRREKTRLRVQRSRAGSGGQVQAS